ncbi:hypothetical protein G6F46_014354 [Rhizopus delemar]|nr:hypothetical protein G6F53_013675 [Rhizopus delemar]KAG1568785.1 hypothetical protein G6F48_013651 [Rhizopus delemar]KAG1571851.1 hypothetical protein G6F47_013640 [Rhizopus delemar]KAG1596851.1 hypothetical protein G6F46_014354 [Rhizopus delemar]KAG1608735.1 hypothetical protein G6F45_013529 [Rhizopus arrhizus]
MSKHDKKFMCRPGFVDSLLKWKSRPQQQNLMLDVYDGNVWKQFGSVNGGLPFVQQSDYNIMLTINMDWFQPFVGTQHSSGGIYKSAFIRRLSDMGNGYWWNLRSLKVVL